MSTDIAQPVAGPSNQSGRTSSRVKNKSQRALESEDTNNLISRARERERARLAGEGGEASGSNVAEGPPRSRSKAASRGNKGAKRVERESWCLCKSTDGSGPMIECGNCNDWFHFNCVNLDQPTAERIHKFICPPCETDTDESTLRLFDISTFRSPTPPIGLLPASTIPKKSTVPRKRPLSKPGKTSVSNTSGNADHHPLEGGSASGSGSGSDDDSSADEGTSSGSGSDSSVQSITRSHPPKRVRIRSRPSTKESKSVRSMDSPVQFYTPSSGPGRLPLKSRPSTGQPIKTGSATSKTVSKKGNEISPNGKVPTLPPARQHVLYKLTEVVRKFFGESMKADEAELYAVELESGLFAAFKDVVGGKDTAGQKYKGQFSMLVSSLQPHLQEVTRTAILSRTLSPAQVAVLPASELASQARADEMEKIKREGLQSVVRQKDDFGGGIIMGRDGMERVERARVAQRDQEESKRRFEEKNERRTSMAMANNDQIMNSPGTAIDIPDSPVPVLAEQSTPSASTAAVLDPIQVATAAVSASASPMARRESNQNKVPPSPIVPSPVKTSFSLTSAWGAGATAETLEQSTTTDAIQVDLGDPSVVDLSDFMQNEDDPMDIGEYHVGSETKEEVKVVSEMEKMKQRPVVFSRGLVNPNDRKSPVPHVQARAISTLPLSRHFGTEEEWRFLLPGETLEWTGRVPSTAGKSFLSQMRLNPKWDVFAMSLTMTEGQGEGVEKVFTGLIDDYVSRDRYAVCLPYGSSPPPRAAKDVYAIPLRPADKYPEFLDLLDGLNIPSERDAYMWILVVVIARDEITAPVYQPQPIIPTQSPAELLKAQNLEALMKSIGTLPPPIIAPTPPHPNTGYSPATHMGNTTPYPTYPTPDYGQQAYPAWTPDPYGGGQYGTAQPYYPPQPQSQDWGAPPPSHGYPQGGGGGYGSPQGDQRWDERDGGRRERGGKDRERGRDRDGFKPQERDQGWGSRKRSGGGGQY